MELTVIDKMQKINNNILDMIMFNVLLPHYLPQIGNYLLCHRPMIKIQLEMFVVIETNQCFVLDKASCFLALDYLPILYNLKISVGK